MHEDGGIDTHDVPVELHHGHPPVFPDVSLEFRPVLGVVVNGAQAVVNFTRLDHIPILLRMRYDPFEIVFLICHSAKIGYSGKSRGTLFQLEFGGGQQALVLKNVEGIGAGAQRAFRDCDKIAYV